MKFKHLLLLLAVEMGLSGCASSGNFYHTTEAYDFTLSPDNRVNTDQGVRLVSISRMGQVTVRMNGILWRARQGEQLANARGGHSFWLKSVDLKAGRVVLEGETRSYYAEGSTKPMMIAR